MDIESSLRMERDLPAVETFLAAGGGALICRPEDPSGLFWVDLRVGDEIPFTVRIEWATYPSRPPSVLFAEGVGGATTVASAWPRSNGYRAPNDICKPFTAEGHRLHPEWSRGAHAWRDTGNPFLFVVETIDADLHRARGARAA